MTTPSPATICVGAGLAYRPARHRAFTLVELLTVIAIVGILAGILIPVVSHANSSARRSHCVGNLRQMGAAFALYAQEHSGRFPAPEKAGTSWYWALQPYVGNRVSGEFVSYAQLNPVFACQEWTLSREQWGATPPDIGYAMSAILTGTADPTREASIAQIANPSQTLLVLENPPASKSYFPQDTGQTMADVATALFDTPANRRAGGGRHGETANYLFVDGHVHALPIQEARRYFAGP